MRYRPKIKVESTGVRRMLELVSVAGVIFIILLLIQNWGSLPDKIPSHFGPDGRADAYGGKSSLIWLLAICLFVFLTITIVNRYPHLFNYFWKITPENAYRQYQLAGTLLAAVKAEVIWTFNYIVITQIKVSRGEAEGLNPLFLYILIALILGSLFVYLYYSYKAR